MNKQDWQKETSEEIGFWEIWFQTFGLDFPEDYTERQDPNLEISQEFVALLGDKLPKVKILDAGCGPFTILGKKFKGKKLDITCTDILADEYNAMMSKYNVTPLCKPIKCDFVDLPVLFSDRKFGFVHAVNCVDHAFDPPASIVGMIRVLEQGGILYLRHLVNEGDHGNFTGLHQWNFNVNENNDFIITDKFENKVNVKKYIDSIANIETKVVPHNSNNRKLIISIITKK